MAAETVRHPWAAVWALLVGFFMTMIDSTIVTVASPEILLHLSPDIINVQWVTSAYLLGLAVPMLITGRLGDRIGPKRVFLIGLAIFTAASAWCGLAGSIQELIIARAIQGLGAACLTPQSMAIITRIFPPEKRGAPLGLWGATAGVAMVVGPVAGGLLVQAYGWRAVFFINIPIGVLGIVLTWFLVPWLTTHRLRLDLAGALLSAIGIFAVVYGLQEAERFRWGTIAGPITVWSVIGLGIAALVLFVVWEARSRGDPLVPLALFRNRSFALGTATIAVVGFTVTAMPMPLMYYYQIVRGLTPAQAALVLIPMAVVSGVLAPLIGRATVRVDPKLFAVCGLLLMGSVALIYQWFINSPRPIWWFLIPSGCAGIASACIWGPLSVVATRDLPPRRAGAGSGVYNVSRQLGSVFGSAALTTAIESHLADDVPGSSHNTASLLTPNGLSPGLVPVFSHVMADTLWLAVIAAFVGAVVALGIVSHRRIGRELAGEYVPTPDISTPLEYLGAQEGAAMARTAPERHSARSPGRSAAPQFGDLADG